MKIAVIGLGYVGLPLAVAFGKKRSIVGFDINQSRINDLSNGIDHTLEVDKEELKEANQLTFTNQLADIADCTIFIVTVPTPITLSKEPDLSPLLSASTAIGSVLKKGDIVIYESTVYPGCTEEVCVPVLEKESGLIYNTDFYCGYSPERINPGDKKHRISDIKKVTSGSTEEIGIEVNELYQDIITAGTHLAPSIRVAEAAKVIENAQRDLNIAFVNELAILFDKLSLDTQDVLEAAGTKWNFLPFKPGLVGGHCIGVDPYYLTHKAESIGYIPEVILSGRKINDGMGAYVANRIIKLLIKKGNQVKGAKILVLGITFKENCPDIRNSKVVDVVNELISFHTKVDVYDPHANAEEVKAAYGINLISSLDAQYDAILLAVPHKEFVSFDLDAVKKSNTAVFDLKGIWDKNLVDERL
ncbi:MAG: nucleotide sugar dehydrogenase [Cyclobacteriaceae bacterium]